MRKKRLFAAVFAVVATALAIALLRPQAIVAETEVPITEIRWFNFASKEGWQHIQFTVPSEDNTKPVSGSKLRLYHVHIARMFEISHFLCDRDRTSAGYDWSYEVANGNINVGRFKISCNLAREIATTYDLGKPKITIIRRNFHLKDGGPSVALEQYSIPVLNLTKNKISQWMNFVKNLTPIRDSLGADKARSHFPRSRILQQIKGKTRVPVFLPSRLPLSDIQQLDFDVKAGSHGYIIAMYFGKGCRGGACYFGTVEATRDEPVSPPSKLPNDTYRSIQLANGIRGTFFNICGPYCIAFVEWHNGGVLYRIKMKNGRQPELVQMVNSAIKAGQR
ncbi:MAG: hypothetical protein HC942_20345 [Microcoleus sp. SU_5_6]|nr:hypothetical protein [Microcoleus sp. SU_5_6]